MTHDPATALLEAPGLTAHQPNALPRLLASPERTSFAEHADFWGPLTHRRDFVGELRRAGLRGRGGAGFETGRKLEAVRAAASENKRRRRRPAVVANGSEGEAASAKDRVLLERSPHLVLDGMVAAAVALEAERAILCVSQDCASVIASVRRALVERRGRDELTIELSLTPTGYVSGEESALVNWLSAGVPVPTVTPPRPSDRGVRGRPTLVDNVETMANLGLIARFGAEWWKAVGTEDDTGSILLTVSGAVSAPGVYEVANGSPLRDVLAIANAGPVAGVLLGGYFGTWVTPGQAEHVNLGRESLASVGASVGCGVVAVLPESACPLEQAARVTRWLAGESAGQCGPCVNGLPAVAGAMENLALGKQAVLAGNDARRWANMVEGRGACKLPDGVARFVLSALDVFRSDIELHQRRGGPCERFGSEQVLPLPGRNRELRWA